MRSTLLPISLSLIISVPAAQAQTAVLIRLTPHQTCQIGDEDLPCADVGSKLQAKHIPRDCDIHITADTTATFQQVYGALTSLRSSLTNAGYRLKVGYINNDGE